ncbi:MAG: ABC transporter permease, partial [Actinobacteria bacterium]|nr:ABC transporter permease [Actinomycetota bacterium]NIX23942.1 ABC transporter permease [Actinomycetota bacterium]
MAQVAAALLVVTSAALLVRSFQALTDVPLAVDPEGVFTFEVHLPTARYPSGDAREAFHRALHERIRSLPGVEAAGAISWLPVNGRYHTWGFRRADAEGSQQDDREWHSSDVRVIGGDYFEAMGIELVRGRRPAEIDLEGEPVVWVNPALAEGVFPDID